MIYIYSLIALFIAWIWVDYYRLIDIFNQEKLKFFIVTFVLGASSVFIVDLTHVYFLRHFDFALNGNPLNDFLFCTFEIGLLEEISKTIPFLLVLLVFRKEFDEPIDYLSFICVSALGFSAAENVMYFNTHGPEIINGKSILCSAGHMFDTSLVAYGIIRYRYVNRNIKGIFFMFVFLLLAALSHGTYDFLIMFDGLENIGWILTILYFLITVSIFSGILTNALNNSSFFTYKKVIDSDKVTKRLMIYYLIVFLIQLLFMLIQKEFIDALVNLLFSLIYTGIIIVITVVRLSRFKLIKNRWSRIRIEFPFTLAFAGFDSTSRSRLIIRGDGYNEIYIHRFYEEYAVLNPVSKRNTQFGSAKKMYLERKFFLKNEDAMFIIRVYNHPDDILYLRYFIKAKTNAQSLVNEKYPIVALFKPLQDVQPEDFKHDIKQFSFQEWAYLTPIKN